MQTQSLQILHASALQGKYQLRFLQMSRRYESREFLL